MSPAPFAIVIQAAGERTAQAWYELGAHARKLRISRAAARQTADATPIVVGIGAWLLMTTFIHRLSTQPMGWHPDEQSKVDQILSGYWNFLHPQLMLLVVELYSWLFNKTDPLSVLVAGRACSAAVAAGSVVILAIIAYRSFGWFAYVATLLACATNPAIFVSGRYFKEEPYLFLGLSLIILSADQIARARFSRNSALLFGLAGAVACSAKYVGIVLFLAALAASLAAVPARRLGRLGFALHALTAFLLGSLVLNIRAVLNASKFTQGFLYELNHVTTEHSGIVWPWTSPIYSSTLFNVNGVVEISLFIVLAVAVAYKALQRALALSPAPMVLLSVIAIIVTYFAIAQFAPVKIQRYIYPVSLLVSFSVPFAFAYLYRLGKPAGLALAGPVAAAFLFVVGHHIGIVHEIAAAATRDTRVELRAWLADNGLVEERILANWYAGLGATELTGKRPELSQLEVIFHVPDRCIDRDCSQFDFIVLSSFAYARYFAADSQRLSAMAEGRRAFYGKLLSHGHKIAEFGGKRCDYLSKYGSYDSPCIYVIRTKGDLSNRKRGSSDSE